MTARTSSIRCSRVGTSATGSDSPVPRLSKMIRRENELIRSKKRANGRRLPLELEVGGEAEDEDHVDRPVADDLVGDRGVAGLA